MLRTTAQACAEAAFGQASAAFRQAKERTDRFVDSSPTLNQASTWAKDGADAVAGKFGYVPADEAVDEVEDRLRRNESQTERLADKLRHAQSEIDTLRRRIVTLEAQNTAKKSDD